MIAVVRVDVSVDIEKYASGSGCAVSTGNPDALTHFTSGIVCSGVCDGNIELVDGSGSMLQGKWLTGASSLQCSPCPLSRF